MAYFGAEKYEEAIEDFTKVITLSPKNDSAYYNRGLAEEKLNNNVSALDDYTKAIELKPEEAIYYYNRGSLISRSGGDLEKAVTDLNTAIKLDGSDSEKYLTRAIIFCKQKNYLIALDDLNIAIKLNPENSTAKELRSYAIKSLADVDEQIKGNK